MNSQDTTFLNNKRERIVTVAFWLLVFAGLSVFFQKYHPLSIYDTDDWTYVKFVRRNGVILPSTKEFNPIKVLPENMTAVAGFFGAYVVKLFCGDYVRSLEISYGLFLCATITVYFVMIITVIDRKFSPGIYRKLILAVFIIFVHFIPFLVSDVNNVHYFYESDSNGIYNNTIPALINVIAICFSIIYEDEISESDFKKHRFLIAFYIGLIYLAINSNLFSNIMIASYALAKLVQYYAESHKLSEMVHKGKYCIFIIIMWCGSLIFEYNGGRAKQVGQDRLDISGAITQLLRNILRMNKCYLAGMLILLCVSVILLIKKSAESPVIGIDDPCRKEYSKLVPVFALNSRIVTIYNILLAAKTDKGYLTRTSVNLSCCFGLMMISYIVIALLIKEEKHTCITRCGYGSHEHHRSIWRSYICRN